MDKALAKELEAFHATRDRLMKLREKIMYHTEIITRHSKELSSIEEEIILRSHRIHKLLQTDPDFLATASPELKADLESWKKETEERVRELSKKED